MPAYTGWAYTPYFLDYLAGVENALALKHVPNVAPRQDWFAGPLGRRADKVTPSTSSFMAAACKTQRPRAVLKHAHVGTIRSA